MFSATVLTLFPELFPGPLGASVLGRALQEEKWRLQTIHLRDFAVNKHRTVDDTPYGGGDGMVLRPDVVESAIAKARETTPNGKPIYLSPRGTRLTQEKVRELSRQPLILLCGRFEGVDDRAVQHLGFEEISIGDYVLAGGEVAAMVLIEACVRLLPGVLGAHGSAGQESFGEDPNYAGLLEYPHYTRPPVWNGVSVPEVLLSGDHGRIAKWRLQQAQETTRQRRPDLWQACQARHRTIEE